MNIQLLGISHKTAPVQIRALFAFTEEKRRSLMEALLMENGITECVVLATCNRTEIYTVSDPKVPVWQVMTAMQRCVLDAVEMDDTVDGASLLRFYKGSQAVRHLFFVAAGLDSMVMGEDQILGQVKEAHRQAMEGGFCSTYANGLFRMAVTAAKKVKTETRLSGISVSTATLAIKAAEEYIGDLDGKNVLLIGATGRIGQIVMKNMISDHSVNLYVTSRRIHSEQVNRIGTDTLAGRHCSGRHFRTTEYEAIAFEQRYRYADVMDVIISATASPHYTLTKERWEAAIVSEKPRILIDMAVPMDIESSIDDGHMTRVCHLDDLTEVADRNQNIRLQAADQAREMLEEEIAQFERWMIFQEHLPLMRSVRDRILDDTTGKAIDKLFYRVRESASPQQLKVFYDVLEQSEKEG
ncbi:MAG: glutamyl-tRNA reductase [Coprococcus sp.]